MKLKSQILSSDTKSGIELESKKKLIFQRLNRSTFKIICNPHLPKDQTFLDNPQTLKKIFDNMNNVLKAFYT